MKKFLSIVLICVLLMAPVASLNCSALWESEGNRVLCQSGVDKNESKVDSDSGSTLSNAIKFIFKTGVMVVVLGGVSVFLLDYFSRDGHFAADLGGNIGEFINKINKDYPGASNTLKKIPGKMETLTKYLNDYYSATRNLITRNVNAFEGGLNKAKKKV